MEETGVELIQSSRIPHGTKKYRERPVPAAQICPREEINHPQQRKGSEQSKKNTFCLHFRFHRCTCFTLLSKEKELYSNIPVSRNFLNHHLMILSYIDIPLYLF